MCASHCCCCCHQAGGQQSQSAASLMPPCRGQAAGYIADGLRRRRFLQRAQPTGRPTTSLCIFGLWIRVGEWAKMGASAGGSMDRHSCSPAHDGTKLSRYSGRWPISMSYTNNRREQEWNQTQNYKSTTIDRSAPFWFHSFSVRSSFRFGYLLLCRRCHSCLPAAALRYLRSGGLPFRALSFSLFSLLKKRLLASML